MWPFKRAPEASPAPNPLSELLDIAVRDAAHLRTALQAERGKLAEAHAKLDHLTFESELAYGREPGEPRDSFIARRELELDAIRPHPGCKAIMNVLLEDENAALDTLLSEKDPVAAERIRIKAGAASEIRSRLITALNTKRVREERVKKHTDSQAAEHARFLRETGREQTS